MRLSHDGDRAACGSRRGLGHLRIPRRANSGNLVEAQLDVHKRMARAFGAARVALRLRGLCLRPDVVPAEGYAASDRRPAGDSESSCRELSIGGIDSRIGYANRIVAIR